MAPIARQWQTPVCHFYWAPQLSRNESEYPVFPFAGGCHVPWWQSDKLPHPELANWQRTWQDRLPTLISIWFCGLATLF